MIGDFAVFLIVTIFFITFEGFLIDVTVFLAFTLFSAGVIFFITLVVFLVAAATFFTFALVFFKIKLTEWKKELVKANNEALYHGSMDDNSVSADIVDQASSYTDKTVEMKAINRQIKLISKIDQALLRIRDKTFGFCAETAEPIGIKRLMARPVAHLCIAAQEKHEKDEKVYADD